MMNKSTTYKPPIEVQANARRALEYRAKMPASKRGMTAVGIARARDLSNGRPQSLEVIQRMASFFARHAVDKQAENWGVGSKGWQAWMAWGGDAGRRWAERILADAMKDDTPVKKAIPMNAPPAPSVMVAPKPVTAVVASVPAPAPVTDGDDSSMAIGQMRAIADKAQKVAQLLRPDTHLESWVQSLVTEAADKVGIVHDYVLYGRNTTEKRMNKSLIQKSQKTFGGEKRENLDDSDFVIHEERKFPIMTAKDVHDAVLSWGRYAAGNPKIAFDTFKTRLIEVARDKGFEDALPKAWMEEEVTTTMGKFFKFATFEKAKPEERVVVGYASSERIDGQNDIVDSDALKGALEDYMQWANLREMHQPKAVGKVLSAVPIKGTVRLSDGSTLVNPLRIIAKIVDEDAWQKVKSGVLKGFSIGGKVVNAITQKVNGKDVRRITGLTLNEISLVDRPANPDARIVMLKRDALNQHDIVKMVKAGQVHELIRKAKIADPADILPMIQTLRNQAEVDGDLDTAERYNEVITLMLEAMGIIPTGTVRDIDNMETQDYPGDDVPADLMDMQALYNQGNAGGPTAGADDTNKRRNTLMYAASATDILKVGRAISTSNMDTLSDIYRAANIIITLCQKLGVQMQDEEASEGEHDRDDHMDASPAPEDGTLVIDVTPVDTAPAAEEASVMDLLANAPIKSMPGNNTGNPIHTAMNPINPNAPAQNVTGGYPIKRSAQNGDLAKSADDAVDIESITKEMQSMESTVEHTPVADQLAGDVTKSAPAIDVSAALQDVIAKSLQGALAGTFAQLDSVAKAVDRIETKSAEQTTAVWDALKPLSETATATKDMVMPLVEKVAALEGVAESVKQLSERLAAIENQPVDAAGAPILRGQSVSKAIGIEGGQSAEQIDESATLAKMIDETHDPLVRTKLRERKALLDTKRVLFGNR